jgi:two-component system LytT family sensor kinase
MFRTYQLKWCFTMIGILAIGTLLMRPGAFSIASAGQYAVHVIIITLTILSCWMIQGYTKQMVLPGYSGYAKALLSIAFSVLVTCAISYVMALLLPQRFFFPENHLGFGYVDMVRRLVGAFLLSMITYVVYSNIDTNDKLQQTRLENEQFKQAHLRAQLLSLQQQISPHFLFNSLSTLKTITRESDTKNFIVQLSHVYRYLLNFNEHQVTRLADELAFIRSYLYILHQRFESALHVNIDVPEAFNNYQIPPLSIQLLIENAIKHNAFSEEKPLRVFIFTNQNQELVVANNREPLKVPVESTRLGLTNIADRFRLLFEREIDIRQTDDNFTVTLPLISYERYHH